jgi:hypothetical protein
MTAIGSLAVPLDVARTTLLASQAFADRVAIVHPPAEGDDVPAETLAAHVFLDQVADGEGLELLRPYALLRYAARGSNVIADGVEISLTVGGGILLVLEDNARQTTDHGTSYGDFLNFAGGVIDDMEDLSGRNDYLPFKSELIYAPTRVRRADRQDDNDYWICVFLLTWGDQA